QFRPQTSCQFGADTHVAQGGSILAFEDVGQALVDRHFCHRAFLYGMYSPPECQLALEVLPTPEQLTHYPDAIPAIGHFTGVSHLVEERITVVGHAPVPYHVAEPCVEDGVF